MIFDTKDSLKDIPSSTNGNRWRSSFMISNRAKFIHNDFLFNRKKKANLREGQQSCIRSPTPQN